MPSQTFVNLSGYRFVALDDPAALQQWLKPALTTIGIKGAVLLAPEGINVTLAGTQQQTIETRAVFQQDFRLQDIWLKTSQSATMPHRKLKVRVRAEIIAFDGAMADSQRSNRPEAANVLPEQLQHWLSEGKDMTLLDARNDYEVESGTFDGAIHLDIKHFRHFKEAVQRALDAGTLDPDKPLVTFCTGGIRCEKAAPWLMDNGFKDVYQIEGGVLNYLKSCGGSHWQGNCFVFDDRVELSPQLVPTGAGLCDHCQLAVPQGTACDCHLGHHYHATY